MKITKAMWAKSAAKFELDHVYRDSLQRSQDATDLLAVMLRILLRKGHTLAIAAWENKAPTVFRLEHMLEHKDIPVIEFDNGDYRYWTGGEDAGEAGNEYGLSVRDLELIQAVMNNLPFAVTPECLEISFAATCKGQRLAQRRADYAARKATRFAGL